MQEPEHSVRALNLERSVAWPNDPRENSTREDDLSSKEFEDIHGETDNVNYALSALFRSMFDRNIW